MIRRPPRSTQSRSSAASDVYKRQFLAHVHCGQTAGWIKMPLHTEVNLGPGDVVLDGVPALRERGTAASTPLFAHVYCGHGRPSQIPLSSCCTAHGRKSLYFTMIRPFPPQNCPFPWGIWTPSNTWFPRPTEVLNPNSISIGSAVFAGLTSVISRPTDQQTTLLGR